MKENALGLLDRLISQKAMREGRVLELLKDPESDHDESWAMWVPTWFNDALDIRRTARIDRGKRRMCWTQGSSFSFKRGYVIYDTPQAGQVWQEALKHIKFYVQIERATNAEPAQGSVVRVPGSVTFAIFVPSRERTTVIERGEHTMTQDDFVRFLIKGPDEALTERISRGRPVV